ncbi:MAG TPA: DUF2147 domain-containing protein [Sphingomicrobium sp.]|nr:DUF2147 domain-containing protein [Sphingomicrobium sp.]
MRRTVLLFAFAALAAAPASAQAIEGQWTNYKKNVVVQVERCGTAFCGRVVQASEKAKAKARKGGTPNLVGTQILTGLVPVGDGKFRGRAFVPKRNIHATATVRQVSDDVMQVQGCVLGGLLCDSERWTRVVG